MIQPDILKALLPVTRALEVLGISYYIAARIELRHIAPLRDSLQGEYYLDVDMIAEAISIRSSFNLIHLETSIKVDVFVPSDEPFQQAAMDRKRRDTLVEGEAAAEFLVSSPEDVILNKLRWYESGGRVSERQWLDVTGVIKVQGDSLDRAYLEKWAQNLKLSLLLKKAFIEAD